jgi:8-oxo-dGTP pyrophosphatase MutT (NUDIX family)
MQKPLRNNSLKITPIIHLFLFASTGLIVLFQRDCGRWGPISGEIKRFEKPIDAARRETMEEIGISIESIYSTDNLFHGISPKGKSILGRTCFAPLPEKIDPEAFTFNNEISRFIGASPNDALRLLARQADFLEGYHGLLFLLRSGIIDIPLTKPFLQAARKAQRCGAIF